MQLANEPGWYRVEGPAPTTEGSTTLPKPSINVHPVAAQYASRNERILEFSGPDGAGGLISLALENDGTIKVHVYRHERTEVSVGTADGE
jgi:hypothetical protein